MIIRQNFDTLTQTNWLPPQCELPDHDYGIYKLHKIKEQPHLYDATKQSQSSFQLHIFHVPCVKTIEVNIRSHLCSVGTSSLTLVIFNTDRTSQILTLISRST